MVLTALWKREILKFVRDRSRVVGAVMQPLAFWALLGMGFAGSFQMPGASEATTTLGYAAFLLPGIVALVVLFTAIFSTISVVEERHSGFLQAALVAPVPRPSFALGTALGGTTLALAQAALFVLAAPLVGLSLTLPGVLLALLVAALLALAFTALGIGIAWRTATTRGFHAVMMLVLMPLWFVSGAAFPVEGAAPVLRALVYANPVTYAVDALRHALYLPSEAPLTVAPLLTSLGITAVFAGLMLAFAVATIRRPLFGSS
jgi:ABC-2 type transport system permease protein